MSWRTAFKRLSTLKELETPKGRFPFDEKGYVRLEKKRDIARQVTYRSLSSGFPWSCCLSAKFQAYAFLCSPTASCLCRTGASLHSRCVALACKGLLVQAALLSPVVGHNVLFQCKSQYEVKSLFLQNQVSNFQVLVSQKDLSYLSSPPEEPASEWKNCCAMNLNP